MPLYMVLDSHFEALVKAGVVPPFGKKRKGRGKKLAVQKRLAEHAPRLKIFIYKAEEGVYWAKVPGVPSCVSVGDTLEEVKSNILDTLEACLALREEAARQEGRLIEEMAI
jgi:predicted RNase H-like HicB family nuclease